MDGAGQIDGVTTVMPYIRSGQCYLWEGGPYRELYPKFLERAKGNYHVDYAYHVSPIEGQHIAELEWLLKEQGAPVLAIYQGLSLGDEAGEEAVLVLEEALAQTPTASAGASD